MRANKRKQYKVDACNGIIQLFGKVAYVIFYLRTLTHKEAKMIKSYCLYFEVNVHGSTTKNLLSTHMGMLHQSQLERIRRLELQAISGSFAAYLFA